MQSHILTHGSYGYASSAYLQCAGVVETEGRLSLCLWARVRYDCLCYHPSEAGSGRTVFCEPDLTHDMVYTGCINMYVFLKIIRMSANLPCL